MHPLLALTAAVVFVTQLEVAEAQVPWVRQSPLPGGPAGNVAFSATRGYMVGSAQVPVETTDGGLSWHARSLGNNGFLSVTFVDAVHGWMVGNHSSLGGGAFRTVDGGATWTEMPNVPYGSYDHIQFVSTTHGWIGTNTVLAETQDGGTSWTLVNLPPAPFQGRLAFRDDLVGVIGGGDGVWRTTDGGASWTHVSDYLPETLQFIDTNTVLLSMPTQFGPADFARSTDAGLTWQAIDVPNVELENPVRVTATTLIANSGGFARNDLYRSIDGGLSWTQILHGTWWPFEGGAFIDATTGVEMGYGGQIFRTEDAGLTWQQVSSGMTNSAMSDIDMLDDVRGVAVGTDGTVFATEDGGTHWRVDRPGFEFSHGETLLSVTTVQPDFVFAAGLYGTLIKSLDGGRTWQGVPGPGAGLGDYWACKFVTELEGWIAGGFDAIYHTTDGGQTWTKQYGGVQFGSGEAVYHIDFTDALHGWAVGTFHGVLITSNGGATWTLHDFGTSFPFGREIDMVDSQVGWFASRDSFIARTTNGGISWAQQPIPADPLHPEQFVFALSAISTTECWAATTHGRVYHTTDAGASWLYVDTGFHSQYDGWEGMRAFADGNVWVTGSAGGGILRRVATPPAVGTAECFGDGSNTACPCGNAGGMLRGCANSVVSAGARLAAFGTPSIASDTLTLSASGVPNGPGLFIQGSAVPPGGLGVPFGDGLLCVGGALRRLGVEFAAANSSALPGATTTAPVHVAGLCAAGDSVHYQLWYRDGAPSYCSSDVFNLTNALRLTWIP